MSYKQAGVDIDAGDALVERIKPLAQSTSRVECIGGLGGFGGLFELAANKYRNPVLVSGTDGVGTKLRLAIETNRHNTVGIDLVAMCVNDIVVCGAEPLFFLDYFATGKLDPIQGESVIAGIAEGCRQAGTALLGGETAEMPGMYHGSDYDLAGFAVGVVEKEQIIDGQQIEYGDVLIGIASSGAHSNGFSLIRQVIDKSGLPLDTPFGKSTLIDTLLEPTRIYVAALRSLIEKTTVHGIAHITGGGLPGNVSRILGDRHHAIIDGSAWPETELFTWLKKTGGIEESEMLRTFNCGIGMVLVVPPSSADMALVSLASSGETAFIIGHIEDGEQGVEVR
ncbi:MAG: phosphoribosylformylglycinamidine cyclo-ligase [marine bacterium B5-7]|nr:MAG: phosphoribosylformylglycinamidine cyclo-ligase [marine bacterium B5-7]